MKKRKIKVTNLVNNWHDLFVCIYEIIKNPIYWSRQFYLTWTIEKRNC